MAGSTDCCTTPAFAAPVAGVVSSRWGCASLLRTSPPPPSRRRARVARHVNAARMMAGGVPKVPYKAPGAQTHEFIDIFNRLYRERIIYIGTDLDDEQANQIIAVLLYLEQTDDAALVQMYFNSPGGTIPAGLAVFDCMQAMKYPITTLNLGLAASMGAFLVGAGTKGKRMSLPNARFLLQAPSLPDVVRGQAADVAIEVRQILAQRDRMIDGLCTFTGRSREAVKTDLKRDMYLTAPEAREYGLIDQVLLPKVPEPSARFIDSLGEGKPGPSFV